MTTHAKPSARAAQRMAGRPYRTDPRADEQRYARGFHAFKQGSYRRALGLFTRLLLGDPLNPRYLVATGACLQRLHRYEDALRPYCLCAAFSPADLLCQLYIAQCLIALGKPEKAAEALRRLLAAATNDDSQQALRQHAQKLLETMSAAPSKESDMPFPIPSRPGASAHVWSDTRLPPVLPARDGAPAPAPGGVKRLLAASVSPLDAFAPVPPPPPRAAVAPPAAGRPAGPDAAMADLDADFTTLMLAINRLSDAQIQDMLASIDDTARMNRGLIQSQLAAAERQAAAIAEQNSAAAAGFWLGLLGDILLLVASVLLTIVTGGAGAFLMAMAVANVALTAWDIVARIHHHRTGQDISLAAGLEAFARDVCGADEKTAREAGQWTALAVKLLVAVGSIAQTVRSAAHAAGHVRTFTTTMQIAGTTAQLGEAGTAIHRNHHDNLARHARLDETSIRALSVMFKERLARALQALDLQFGQRQEFTRDVRRNLESMHESRAIPFSHYA